MTRESNFWAWIKNGAKKLEWNGSPEYLLDRIENSAVSSMPDVSGASYRMGTEFWLELKVNRRATILRPKFRPGQADWLYRRWNLGARAWLLVKHGEGLKSHYYLVPGNLARQVENGVPLLAAGAYSRVPLRATVEQILERASTR